MKLQMLGTVGRATVPADSGRHGGRPYAGTRRLLISHLIWLDARSHRRRLTLPTRRSLQGEGGTPETISYLQPAVRKRP